MKPYSRRSLAIEHRIFNYRLSRARRISENGFGILAARWGIFHRPLCFDIRKIRSMILSTILLHNFLRNFDQCTAPAHRYIGEVTVDFKDMEGRITEGAWRKDVPQTSALQPLGRVGYQQLHSSCFRSKRFVL